MDVFEDHSEDEQPGPGQYYNADRQTAFRKNTVETRSQKFGSGVDRFHDPYDAKTKEQQANIGPGAYNVMGRSVVNRSLHQLVYSGFTSSESRFNELTKPVTPGPGQYDSGIVSD